MDDTNIIRCKKCGHDEMDHYKLVKNPDFNHGPDKELDAGVCKVPDCNCKLFEEV